ncbi:MAG: thioesterase family protein [Atribacterota bacterium]|jgi:predicted thioesterase|nr:thioesterase family protein [Atribacterota bacterium]MDD3030952.1 thioesterase family protein [Atribacterota bacterium]MDD3640977.1 thioesterase family protein [Atribacterota bacterium]MDD4289119.1 thioesterase family protein [Atribacterota bacterium]MDD4765802.1 thioesterase family protein [Atribacterota bacterium]
MIEVALEKGMKGVSQVVVKPENMAENFSKPMPPSFATPMLVSLMDNAAIEAVKKKLPAGYITVGSSISIKHLAPTPEGMTVTAEAELKDIFKNRLIFHVTAFDEIEKIGEGEVERYIIDLEKFSEKILIKKNAEEKPV